MLVSDGPDGPPPADDEDSEDTVPGFTTGSLNGGATAGPGGSG